MGDAVLDAHALEPVGPAPPGRHHHVARGDDGTHAGRVLDGDPSGAAVLHEDLAACGLEQHRDARVVQGLLDAAVDLLRALGSQMADGAVDELEARGDGAAADLLARLLVADPLDMVVGTEGEVHGVDAVDRLLGARLADELGEVASHLVGKGQLAVGEGPRARKARRDAAGVAPCAAARAGFGAEPLLDRQAPLHHHDRSGTGVFDERERAEDSRRAGAHDDDVGLGRDLGPGAHSRPRSSKRSIVSLRDTLLLTS